MLVNEIVYLSMNKITLNKIASIDNLELACKRVLKTEDSKRIKRLTEGIRDIYNDKGKLKAISERIIANKYEPKPPYEINRVKSKPGKPIQTIKILCPSDEIVYQAISNLIATKLYDKIENIQRKHSIAFRLHENVKTEKDKGRGRDGR